MAAAYTITQIEDAILAALEPLKASHGVRTLESYDLRLEDPEAWKRLTIKFPAVFVLFADLDDTDLGQRQLEAQRFQIGMADSSLRPGEARRGGLRVEGSYGLIHGVQSALAGKILLPDLLPAMRRGVQRALIADGVAMYVATYTIGQGYLAP
jgi:phage gp37-like protein